MLKALTLYLCIAGGACGVSFLAGNIALALGFDLALSVASVGIGVVVGIVIGCLATEEVWSLLNWWLGPPV